MLQERIYTASTQILAAPAPTAVAPSVSGLGVGGTLIFLVLLGWIAHGIKKKTLQISELLICGTFGLLLGATVAGPPARTLVEGLGNFLIGLIS